MGCILLLATLALIAPANAATARDRDVIEAYIQSSLRSRDPKTDLPPMVLMHKPSGQVAGICRTVLTKKLQDDPDRETFLRELENRARLEADYSAFTWTKPIRLTLENRMTVRMAERLKSKRPFELEYCAELPAYAPAGDRAVLVTWHGPNHIHTVRYVSLMKKTEKGWTVVWSAPAYYV